MGVRSKGPAGAPPSGKVPETWQRGKKEVNLIGSKSYTYYFFCRIRRIVVPAHGIVLTRNTICPRPEGIEYRGRREEFGELRCRRKVVDRK